MSVFSAIKNKVSSIFSPQKSQANALQAASSVVPNQTLIPNISTPQGIGQTQPNGSITLLNKQGVATGSVIDQKGVGSTPMPSQPTSPYYTPPTPTPTPTSSSPTVSQTGSTTFSTKGGYSRNVTPNQTPIPATPAEVYSSSKGGGIAGAYNALKNAFQGDSANANNTTGVNQTPIPTPPASATATLAPGAQAVATTNPQAAVTGAGDAKSQYKVITQDKTSDSNALQNQLSQAKAMEDNQKQAQVQSIKEKIAALTAQRDQMIAAGEQSPLDRTQLDTLGVDTPYAPNAQPAISQVSAQLDALEKELLSAMQDSPEFTAANEALNAKIAEEANIKARLVQGQTNIAEQPIAYSFIGGQQEALQRRANADLQTNSAAQIPLTQRLATEQAKKQSAIDVVKTKYGSLADERDRLVDTYKTNYSRATSLADREDEQRRKLELEASKPRTTSSSPGIPPGTNSTAVNQLKDALKASAFQGPEADGKYADPNLYLANYQNWIASGGSAEEFFRNFPPSTYINPANTWLPSEIMQFVKAGGRSV